MRELRAGSRGAFLSVKAGELASLDVEGLRAVLAGEKEYNRLLPCGDTSSTFYAGVSDERLEALARALRIRLETETDLLDPFLRLGLDPFAADLLAQGTPFQVEVVDALDSTSLLGGHASACFRQGVILHVGAPPGLRQRLGDLARRGFIGNDLFHEVIHGLQNGAGYFGSLADVIHLIENDGYEAAQARTALAEAHAWLRTLPGFKPKVLIRSIAAAYGLTYPAQLQAAFVLLWGLIVLGEDDTQLGRLIARANWHIETETYPLLQARTRDLCQQQALSPDQLAALRERRLMIDRIQAVRAMGVARELSEGASVAAGAAARPTEHLSAVSLDY